MRIATLKNLQAVPIVAVGRGFQFSTCTKTLPASSFLTLSQSAPHFRLHAEMRAHASVPALARVPFLSPAPTQGRGSGGGVSYPQGIIARIFARSIILLIF